LILCSEKNDVVRYVLADKNEQVFASRYQFVLDNIVRSVAGRLSLREPQQAESLRKLAAALDPVPGLRDPRRVLSKGWLPWSRG
jgi:hypothetical protein